jgi:hypothetical protein
MKNIEINTTCAIEIDGKEYTVLLTATVYPATIAENGEAGQPQRIEIDNMYITGSVPVIWNLFPPTINGENYDRCIMAVQNEIESQLNLFII